MTIDLLSSSPPPPAEEEEEEHREELSLVLDQRLWIWRTRRRSIRLEEAVEQRLLLVQRETLVSHFITLEGWQ